MRLRQTEERVRFASYRGLGLRKESFLAFLVPEQRRTTDRRPERTRPVLLRRRTSTRQRSTLLRRLNRDRLSARRIHDLQIAYTCMLSLTETLNSSFLFLQ